MALRELVASLGYKVDKKSESQVKSSIGSLKKLAVGLGAAFGARAIFRGIKGAINEVRTLADEMDKTSQQIGLTAQSLEELRFAATLAGVGTREMSDGLAKLQKNAFEAATGNKTLKEDFDRLGVSVTDASGRVKTGDQLISEMADGMARLDNDTEKVGLSMNLMGRSGKKLIPLLNQGSKALEAQRKEARELGGVFGDDLIKQSVELTDDMARLDFFLRGLKATFAKEFIPILTDAIRRLTKLGASFRGDVQKGAAILAKAFTIFSDALLLIVRNLPTVIALMGGLLIITAPMTTLLLALSALILLVVDDFKTMGEGGNSVIGGLINEFKFLLSETDSVLAALGGILSTAVNFWSDLILGIFGTSLKEVTEDFDRLLKLIFGAQDSKFVKGVLQGIVDPTGILTGSNPAFAGAGGGGGNSLVNQPNTNVSVTINGSPGDSTADLARTGAKEFKRAAEDTQRQALRDLSPS